MVKTLDATGLPSSNQRYRIPASFASAQPHNHDSAIYSIWTHFAVFLVSCRAGKSLQSDDSEAADVCNKHVPNRARLSVFVNMCTLSADGISEEEQKEQEGESLHDNDGTDSIAALATVLGSYPGSLSVCVSQVEKECKPDYSPAPASSPTSVTQFARLSDDCGGSADGDIFSFHVNTESQNRDRIRVSRIMSPITDTRLPPLHPDYKTEKREWLEHVSPTSIMDLGVAGGLFCPQTPGFSCPSPGSPSPGGFLTCPNSPYPLSPLPFKEPLKEFPPSEAKELGRSYRSALCKW